MQTDSCPTDHLQTQQNADDFEPLETGRGLLTDHRDPYPVDLELQKENPGTPPTRRAIRKRRMTEQRVNTIQPLNLNLTIPPLSQTIGSDDLYYVKGPMGKGLQIENTGQHVAFCAGTGVLVFLDLVSHLLVRNCFEHHQREVPEVFDQMKKGFKFHLYVSFQNRD